MPMKTLLVIGPEPPPAGGMETTTQALLAELRRAGIPYVRVDTADASDKLGNRGRLTLRNVWLAVRHALDVMRETRRPDVSAVYLPIAQEFPALIRDIAFVLIGRMARLPTIIHLNGGAFGDFYASQSRPVRYFLRKTLGGAALGIVLTESYRPCLQCVLPAERVAVVANGVDLPVEPGRPRPDDAVRILFLSALVRWKGPLVFIEAFGRARRQCPNMRATVAGDWADDAIRDEARQLARELDVDDIDFPGAVDGEDKRALFEMADVFCFASMVTEGQPLVILEAMAAGLPVIAPVGPGVAEEAIDGETALLVPEPTADALAAKLVELARDPEMRMRLGSAGRRRYEELFTQRAFGARMIPVLQPYLDRRSAERV